MNSNWYKVIMKLVNARYGKNLLLKGVPVIYNSHGGTLEIGNDVVIKSGTFSNLVGLYQRTIIITRTKTAKIIIGDRVGISGATIYAREGIHIGDDTIIGANAKILDNDFHPVEIEDRHSKDKSKIKAKGVYIGKNCFIGCNTIILKGTVLGDNCVVGAGGVVSGTFESNCIIVGNPARVVKKLKVH